MSTIITKLVIVVVALVTLSASLSTAVALMSRVTELDLPLEQNLQYSIMEYGGDFFYSGVAEAGAAARIVKFQTEPLARIATLTIGGATADSAPKAAIMAPNNDWSVWAIHDANPSSLVHVTHRPTFGLTAGVSTLVLESGEQGYLSGVSTTDGTISYWAGNTQNILKIAHTATTLSRVAVLAVSLGTSPYEASIMMAPDNTHIFLANTAVPAQIVKISLAAFTQVTNNALNSGDTPVRSAMIAPDGVYVYLVATILSNPSRIIRCTTTPYVRELVLAIGTGAQFESARGILILNRWLYLGFVNSNFLVRINLDAFTIDPVEQLNLQSGELNIYTPLLKPNSAMSYWPTNTNPAKMIQVNLDTSLVFTTTTTLSTAAPPTTTSTSTTTFTTAAPPTTTRPSTTSVGGFGTSTPSPTASANGIASSIVVIAIAALLFAM